MNDAPVENTIVSALDIISDLKTKDDYDGKKANLFHELFPANGERWSFIQVSSFLNEFTEFTKSYCTKNERKDEFYTLTFHSKTDNSLSISIRIHNDWQLSLYANMPFLDRYGRRKEEMIVSSIGSQNRKLKIPKVQHLVHYVISLHFTSDTSLAILNNQPIFMYPMSSFSEIFNWFVLRIFSFGWRGPPLSIDSRHLYDYHSSFIHKSKKTENINSREKFCEETIGYLHLNLTEYLPGDKLETIDIEDKTYSIINGIYISPYAQSVFKDNEF